MVRVTGVRVTEVTNILFSVTAVRVTAVIVTVTRKLLSDCMQHVGKSCPPSLYTDNSESGTSVVCPMHRWGHFQVYKISLQL